MKSLAQLDNTISNASDKFTNLTKEGLVGFGNSFANWLLGLVALVAVGMIIYAGYLFITSGLDDKKITTAKNILLYAVIGIIVLILSFAIVSFSNSLLK